METGPVSEVAEPADSSRSVAPNTQEPARRWKTVSDILARLASTDFRKGFSAPAVITPSSIRSRADTLTTISRIPLFKTSTSFDIRSFSYPPGFDRTWQHADSLGYQRQENTGRQHGEGGVLGQHSLLQQGIRRRPTPPATHETSNSQAEHSAKKQESDGSSLLSGTASPRFAFPLIAVSSFSAFSSRPLSQLLSAEIAYTPKEKPPESRENNNSLGKEKMAAYESAGHGETTKGNISGEEKDVERSIVDVVQGYCTAALASAADFGVLALNEDLIRLVLREQHSVGVGYRAVKPLAKVADLDVKATSRPRVATPGQPEGAVLLEGADGRAAETTEFKEKLETKMKPVEGVKSTSPAPDSTTPCPTSRNSPPVTVPNNSVVPSQSPPKLPPARHRPRRSASCPSSPVTGNQKPKSIDVFLRRPLSLVGNGVLCRGVQGKKDRLFSARPTEQRGCSSRDTTSRKQSRLPPTADQHSCTEVAKPRSIEASVDPSLWEKALHDTDSPTWCGRRDFSDVVALPLTGANMKLEGYSNCDCVTLLKDTTSVDRSNRESSPEKRSQQVPRHEPEQQLSNLSLHPTENIQRTFVEQSCDQPPPIVEELVALEHLAHFLRSYGLTHPSHPVNGRSFEGTGDAEGGTEGQPSFSGRSLHVDLRRRSWFGPSSATKVDDTKFLPRRATQTQSPRARLRFSVSDRPCNGDAAHTPGDSCAAVRRQRDTPNRTWKRSDFDEPAAGNRSAQVAAEHVSCDEEYNIADGAGTAKGLEGEVHLSSFQLVAGGEWQEKPEDLRLKGKTASITDTLATTQTGDGAKGVAREVSLLPRGSRGAIKSYLSGRDAPLLGGAKVRRRTRPLTGTGGQMETFSPARQVRRSETGQAAAAETLRSDDAGCAVVSSPPSFPETRTRESLGQTAEDFQTTSPARPRRRTTATRTLDTTGLCTPARARHSDRRFTDGYAHARFAQHREDSGNRTAGVSQGSALQELSEEKGVPKAGGSPARGYRGQIERPAASATTRTSETTTGTRPLVATVGCDPQWRVSLTGRPAQERHQSEPPPSVSRPGATCGPLSALTGSRPDLEPRPKPETIALSMGVETSASEGSSVVTEPSCVMDADSLHRPRRLTALSKDELLHYYPVADRERTSTLCASTDMSTQTDIPRVRTKAVPQLRQAVKPPVTPWPEEEWLGTRNSRQAPRFRPTEKSKTGATCDGARREARRYRLTSVTKPELLLGQPGAQPRCPGRADSHLPGKRAGSPVPRKLTVLRRSDWLGSANSLGASWFIGLERNARSRAALPSSPGEPFAGGGFKPRHSSGSCRNQTTEEQRSQTKSVTSLIPATKTRPFSPQPRFLSEPTKEEVLQSLQTGAVDLRGPYGCEAVPNAYVPAGGVYDRLYWDRSRRATNAYILRHKRSLTSAISGLDTSHALETTYENRSGRQVQLDFVSSSSIFSGTGGTAAPSICVSREQSSSPDVRHSVGTRGAASGSGEKVSGTVFSPPTEGHRAQTSASRRWTEPSTPRLSVFERLYKLRKKPISAHSVWREPATSRTDTESDQMSPTPAPGVSNDGRRSARRTYI